MRNDYLIRGTDLIIFLRTKAGIRETVADVTDFDIVNSISGRWYAKGDYVACNINNGGKYTCIRLHLLLAGVKPGFTVDHKDGDTFNNRRMNLRHLPKGGNQQNTKCNKRSKSGVRGVHWHKRTGKWYAVAYVNKKRYSIGAFDTIPEAKAAVTEFRRINLPYSNENYQEVNHGYEATHRAS